MLGSNFVRALLQKGEDVQVWNRTASKASELEQYGAQPFPTPAEAVRGADIIHLTLKDDAAVNEVLEAALPGLAPNALIIDHTTTSKEGAIERTKRWKEGGFAYQHAPVFMGPANALESTGFILVSGERELIQRIEPHLSRMTGRVLHFGEEVGKAAAMKLLGNAFLVCFTAGIRETLALAKAMEIQVADLSALFDHWNPGALLTTRLKRMTAGDSSTPSWELAMARKDTGLFLDAAEGGQTELVLIPAIAALMDEWIHKGYGAHDWTVIAKDTL